LIKKIRLLFVYLNEVSKLRIKNPLIKVATDPNQKPIEFIEDEKGYGITT
jgi:hypothetical protein